MICCNNGKKAGLVRRQQMRPYTGTSKTRRLAAILTGSVAVLSLTSCAIDQGRMASLGPPPYLALNSGPQPSAVAQQNGYFTAEHGCVVFRPAWSERAMTPVFPAGRTVLATDGAQWLGMFLNDVPVAMGKAYRLTGTAASQGDVALTSPAPAGCPSTYFVVGSLNNVLAESQMSRFCSGVILCTSYDLD
jgi:hypothetical protein